MKIKYKDWNPSARSLELVELAEQIMDEYAADNYTLTLRQLYYQFVSRDLIPNTQQSYNSLGNVITNARTAGLLSWTSIEDRGRGKKGWLIERNVHRLYF